MVSKEIVNAIARKINKLIFKHSQENLVEPFGTKGKIISDTGGLLKSGKIIKTSNGYEVNYSAPHSSYIEYGTVPHVPPFNPLYKWAKRKLGLSDKEAYKIAKAIQWKIAKHGTEPKAFLRKAYDQTIEDLRFGVKVEI